MRLWELLNPSVRIDELLDQPYEWEWTISNSVGRIAEFQTSNDTIEVTLSKGQDTDGTEITDIMFESRSGGLNITNNGNAFKIFATVADVTRAFFKDTSLTPIRFSAKESSRIKLYQRLAKMIANELLWKVRTVQKDSNTYFYIEPSSQVNEDGKIIPGVNTTVDVQPGETERQAAKFGNKLDAKSRPPLLRGSYGDDSARFSANQGDPYYGSNGTKLTGERK